MSKILFQTLCSNFARLNVGINQNLRSSVRRLTSTTTTTTTTSSNEATASPSSDEPKTSEFKDENPTETPLTQTPTQNELNPFELAGANRIEKKLGWQPTVETHSKLNINGTPYNKLPIISIKASRNNTIMTLSDGAGVVLHSTSAGVCGFKNSKKSTAVAGQAAGLAMSENAKRRGIENVRVVVKGFGNGRLSSIKALQLGKLNIISVTDNTPIPMAFAKPPRPPARRKL